MDKVKITREQADTIDYLRSCNLSNIDIVQQKIGDKFSLGTHSKNNKVLTSIDFDTLMKALVNGYEVEETPEDKVRKMFDGARPDGFDLGDVLSYRKGIMDTLKALNIKIEGIN